MVQRFGHYDGMSKTDWNILDVDMEKDRACKVDRHNKNAVVLERVGEGRITLELIKKRKKKLAVPWLRWNCLLKNALEGMVKGRKFTAQDIR